MNEKYINDENIWKRQISLSQPIKKRDIFFMLLNLWLLVILILIPTTALIWHHLSLEKVKSAREYGNNQ